MKRFEFRVSNHAFARLAACGVAMLGLLCASAALASPMDEETLFTLPERSETIHPRLAPLMAEALDEPTQLARIKALNEIARYKMTDLAGRVAELLGDPSPVVRTTALRTLDALDAKDKAELIVRFAQPPRQYDADAIEQMQLADGMLARWKHRPAAALWIARVAERVDDPTAVRITAAQALATAGVAEAPDAAREAMKNGWLPRGNSTALRLASADALAALSGGGDEPVGWALQLADDKTDPIGTLLAARMLATSSSARAVDLLKRLAVDPSTAVQAAALGRLVAIDPKLVESFAADAIKSHDPSVRVIPAGALRHVTTPAAVDLLLGTLNDEHPDVRNAARGSLVELAKTDALNDRVDAGLVKIIDDGIAEAKSGTMVRWRAAEQAALAAGEVDHKPAAGKLVELFTHPRLEVRVGAVAGLRPLNVAATHQPTVALLGRLLDEMDKRAVKAKSESPMFRGEQVGENTDDSKLLSETAQTLGVWGVMEADPLLRRVIPKEAATHSFARAAGIWALGMLHRDKPDAKLARDLILRVYDLNPNNPEANEVRLHSIIAVGRMKATTELKGVRGRLVNDGLDIRSACRWAIMNMTDEKLPEIVLEPAERSDAFISPLR